MSTFEEVLDKVKNVQTTIPKEELEVLYKYAQKVPKDGIIVDIGTCRGGSSLLMGVSNPDVKVWTIDPILNKEFIRQRKELGLKERVHFLNDTSSNAILEWNKEIDLLFIDGIHSVEGIKNDLNSWGKFVKEGSYILLHDYFWYGYMVERAIEESEIDLELIETPFGLYDGKKVGIAVTKK